MNIAQFEWNNVFILSGLFLDIIGAFVIAIPDISYLRRFHKPGRLWLALRNIEIDGIDSQSTGYEDFMSELDNIIDEPVDEDIIGVGIKYTALDMSGPNGQIHGINEVGDEPDPIHEGNFEQIRRRLREDIRKGESKIRGIGFLLLCSGFILQMVGTAL
ncbi:hypothetical protein HZS55_16480 [Halosimplex rubrum]|uniref:Uncharacterized protein n=1 Tax=Halosimplex rubrum TaxID=869889 RepID=A0A7D5T740_9EURY|nr:hypothetical protein [Halosimplex rubrum]QLH78789.1 hypothetical protein HZS55_16480 [Halosimplex rubrum]